MSDQESVLIISPFEDSHARVVEQELRKLGVYVCRLDTADLPNSMNLSVGYGSRDYESLVVGEEVIRFEKLIGVWLRRPAPHDISDEVVQRDAYLFAARCTRSAIYGGLLGACENVINPYGHSEEARFKPFQLAKARVCGLNVPKTLVTQDSDRVLEFWSALRSRRCSMIYKTVSTWHYGLKETRLFRNGDVSSLKESLKYCPVIFQEYIEGDYDLRITVVGEQVFAAKIHICEGRSPIDGRLDRVSISSYEIDDEFRSQLLKLHRQLNLVYGAYDFRVSKEGEKFFLEVNPEGQYLYIEIQTGHQISLAIAKRLAALS